MKQELFFLLLAGIFQFLFFWYGGPWMVAQVRKKNLRANPQWDGNESDFRRGFYRFGIIFFRTFAVLGAIGTSLVIVMAILES
ncbi:hypothetical protein [Aureicoccus marinus]|uniref:Uncharacterized protein n=1 Tax=Aureicoccus marinus TaxID=754435 RepID=A0A2S7T418_9FLAO|nr:hypothetical protein [Aureicoccus marinus]PQJ14404.1 hypothetical protein BST99_00375 [Aureicoccus marinus]